MRVAKSALWFGLLFLPVLALSQTTVTLRPTGDGSVKQWNNNAGASCASNACYSQVNETTGLTNCAASATVKGDGVLNKSPGTTGRVEQYALTLSGIPDNSLIQSITVHACQARGGSTSTTGTLRIVLNGATTACSTNQTAGTTFTDVSCTFGSLNFTKSGGTTLEIGNATTQNRAIWMDSTEAEVTYIAQQVGDAAAAVNTSPALTAVKAHPVPIAVGFTTSPAPTAVNGTPNQTGSVAAAFHSDAPCCILTSTPLSATFHIGPGIAVQRAMSQGTSAAFQTSPTAIAVKGQLGGSVTAAFKTDVPCCVLTNSPLSDSLHISPVVNVTNQSSGSASVSSGLSTSTIVSVSVGGQHQAGVAASLHTDAPCCVSTGYPLSASFHVAPAVTGIAHGSQNAILTQGLTTSATCQACTSTFFSSASFHIFTNATGQAGQGKAVTAAFQTSPAVSLILGLTRTPVETFTTSPAVGTGSVNTGTVSEGFTTLVVAAAAGPGQKTGDASVLVHSSPDVDVSGTPTTGSTQSATFGVVVTAGLGLHQPANQSVHFAVVATAFTHGPRTKTPMVIQ